MSFSFMIACGEYPPRVGHSGQVLTRLESEFSFAENRVPFHPFNFQKSETQ